MKEGPTRKAAAPGQVKKWMAALLRQSRRLLQLPQQALRGLLAAWRGQALSRRMARRARRLRMRPDSLQLLLAACRRMAGAAAVRAPAQEQAGGGWSNGALEAAAELGDRVADDGGGQVAAASRPAAARARRPQAEPSAAAAAARLRRERELCSGTETELLRSIQERTERCNRNNVTRTQAYWELYRRHPELHWALLAHMVSRNGGWNMTDLQGGLLPGLLQPQQREDVFCLLERANSFIFADAYPQLLLYVAGKRAARDLSYLLPALGVSRFMFPAWRIFWRDRDSALLTVSLIINEQNVVEQRVVQHPQLRERVVEAPFMELQSLLQLNQVVFPYSFPPRRLRLAGLIVENFGDLEERIELGKQLYAMLLGIPDIYSGVIRFARTVRHSGSRADYAPHLFSPRPEGEAAICTGGAIRTEGERMAAANGQRIYSPQLIDVWPDRVLEDMAPGDWFTGEAEVERHLQELSLPSLFEMTSEYRFGLTKLTTAAAAARKLGLGPN